MRPGDIHDVENTSRLRRQHFQFKDKEGNLIYEVGKEYARYDNSTTHTLTYNLRGAVNSSIGHYGDESNPTEAKPNAVIINNNCLFDEMSRVLNLDSVELRLDAELMRSEPYAFTSVRESLQQLGIQNSEFVLMVDLVNAAMLVGGSPSDASKLTINSDQYTAYFGEYSNYGHYRIVINKNSNGVPNAVDEVHIMNRNGIHLITNTYATVTRSTLRQGNRKDFSRGTIGVIKQMQGGRSSDDAGHLVASQLGGTGDAYNLTFQDRSLNQGWQVNGSSFIGPKLLNWRQMEKFIYHKIKSCEYDFAKIKIDVEYNEDSNRPETFIYNVAFGQDDDPTNLVEIRPHLFNNDPRTYGLNADTSDLVASAIQGLEKLASMSLNDGKLPTVNDTLLNSSKISASKRRKI